MVHETPVCDAHASASEAATVTSAPSAAYQFRENGSHYNGGATWFGYGYEAIGEPRLRMVRKWFRQGEKRGVSEDSFSVDGAPVADYAAALEALKTPPTLSEAEAVALAAFGDVPIRRPRDQDFEACVSVARKGFVHTEDGNWTITEAGRAALTQSEQQS